MNALAAELARTARLVLGRIRFGLLLLGVVLLVGYWDTLLGALLQRWRGSASQVVEAQTEFFCPMDPQVVRGAPSSCPICGMPLSKRARRAADVLPPGVLTRVQLTPKEVALAGVRTFTVARRPLDATLDMVGTMTADERRVRRVTSRVKGRIERLRVDFVGAEVRQGDPLVSLYSPEILSTATEMLSARGSRGAGLEAAREQLVLFGLTPAQLDEMVAGGEAPTHVDVLSTVSGTVLAKHVLAGDYVDVGSPLYTVADLSVLWLVVRVFEDEMSLVDVGREVEVCAVSSFAPEVFVGRVAFVDQVVDRATRTVNVRVDVPNPDRSLRPGLFARARLRTPIGADGLPRRRATSLVYRCCDACPQVVSSVPGECPQCSMPLTPVEQIGQSTTGAGEWACRCRIHPNDVYRASRPGACALCATALVKEEATGPSIRSRTATLYECPGHPEATRDTPGGCLLCGTMELIAREAPWEEAQAALGRAKPGASRPLGGVAEARPRAAAASAGTTNADAPLVVPVDAVIDTGTRRVVYVESSPGTFDAVEVTVGPRVDEWFAVIRGLTPGQRVVARGAFLVDAQARLNPSSASVYFGASGKVTAPPSGGR